MIDMIAERSASRRGRQPEIGLYYLQRVCVDVYVCSHDCRAEL